MLVQRCGVLSLFLNITKKMNHEGLRDNTLDQHTLPRNMSAEETEYDKPGRSSRATGPQSARLRKSLKKSDKEPRIQKSSLANEDRSLHRSGQPNQDSHNSHESIGHVLDKDEVDSQKRKSIQSSKKSQVDSHKLRRESVENLQHVGDTARDLSTLPTDAE
jgi:hypothetical protein